MKLSSSSKTWLFSILAIVLASLLLESVSRVGVTVLDDLASFTREPFIDWYALSPDLGWERRAGYRGTAWGVPREFDESGLFSIDSSHLLDPAPSRIVFLGDSNTFGLYVRAEETFVEVVDRAMPEVDAINWGVPGYSSYQGRILLSTTVLPLEPDVVVISFGYNDRRMVRRPSHVDGQPRFNDIYARFRKGEANRKLELLYAYRGLGKVMGKLGLLPVAESTPPSDLAMDAWLPRVSPSEYRANLQAMVRSARNNGAEVVFLLLADNPAQTVELDLGIEAYGQGEIETAIQNLKVAVARNNLYSPLARISLAQVYRSQGNENEARRELREDRRKSIFGGTVRYRDRNYHLIMREVAMELDVVLVDVEELLEDMPWLYQDECHFDAGGHEVVGEHLQGILEEVIARRL